MSRVVPINRQKAVTSDLGWEECRSCAHANSGTCDFCEEADQYEEADLESLLRHRELLAA